MRYTPTMFDLLDHELKDPRVFFQKVVNSPGDGDLLESIKKNPFDFVDLVIHHKSAIYGDRDAKIRTIKLAFESASLEAISLVPQVFPNVKVYNYLHHVVIPVILRDSSTCEWTRIEYLNCNEAFLSGIMWSTLFDDEEKTDPNYYCMPSDCPKPVFISACGFLYDAALSVGDFVLVRWLRDRNFVLPYKTFFKWRCHLKKIHEIFRNFAYCKKLIEDLPSDEADLAAEAELLFD
jgi:hypothetical protein